MAGGYLKTLTIERLRGSVRSFELPFQKGKKLTIVYGEKGTGKSTICDALDFLGNGQVGSPATRGLGSTYKYWPAIGSNAQDMSLCLKSSTGSCTAQLANRNVLVDAADQRPSVLVFRRPQILSLVEAKPAERYEAIRRFIDVTGVETSEKNLNSLIRTLYDERKLATERVSENQNTIMDFWKSEGAVTANPIDWAREAVQREPVELNAERLAIASLRTAYERLIGFPQRLRTAQQGLANAQSAVQQQEAALEVVLDRVEAGAEDLSDLLHAAHRYFGVHPDLRECPLCESADKIEGLTSRVASRVDQLLEAALDFLTSLYQCRVPRRPEGKYTLGDLLPAIDKKLKQALSVNVLIDADASGESQYRTVEIGPILSELARIAQARNVFGAHFNELAFCLPDTDALEFGRHALSLLESLACPEAGWPRRVKSGSYWANDGETRQLYPLQRPS